MLGRKVPQFSSLATRGAAAAEMPSTRVAARRLRLCWRFLEGSPLEGSSLESSALGGSTEASNQAAMVARWAKRTAQRTFVKRVQRDRARKYVVVEKCAFALLTDQPPAPIGCLTPRQAAALLWTCWKLCLCSGQVSFGVAKKNLKKILRSQVPKRDVALFYVWLGQCDQKETHQDPGRLPAGPERSALLECLRKGPARKTVQFLGNPTLHFYGLAGLFMQEFVPSFF